MGFVADPFIAPEEEGDALELPLGLPAELLDGGEAAGLPAGGEGLLPPGLLDD